MIEPEQFHQRWQERGVTVRPASWLAYKYPHYTGLRFLMVLAFTALWIADGALVALFGVELEANPLVAWIIRESGWFTFAVVKLMVLSIWLYVGPYARTWIHVISVAVMAPVVLLGCLIAF